MTHNSIICGDCLEVMKDWPDNCVDLVLTDPPYGLEMAEWDNKPPTLKCFAELFRVSKNQIIWGGNYFSLPHTESWLCWDKTYRFHRNIEMAEFELAWDSFEHKAKFIRYTYCGNFYGWNNPKAHYDKPRLDHPTQKPVELGLWCVKNFSDLGQIILDTHTGSGTFCVAAKMLGRRYIGIDISEEYCQIARERLQAVETGVPVQERRAGQGSLFE